MSSAGTISTGDTSRISSCLQAQDINSILKDPNGRGPIDVTYNEISRQLQRAMDLEYELQLWKQSLSGKVEENDGLNLKLRESDLEAMRLRACINDMRFHLQQQDAMMTSVKKQTAETFRLKEGELQKLIQANLQLEIERHRNVRVLKFIVALKLMNPGDLGHLIGGENDFDGVLASHPTTAQYVEKMEQENVAKDKILEEYNGVHQQLRGRLARLR